MKAAEWVAESDWSKVPRGRRIQLRSGSGFIEGVSLHSEDESLLVGYKSEGPGQHSRREYKHFGWELFTEKPSVVLPTEPGWYLTGSLSEAVYLAADGYWTTPSRFGVTGEDMADHGPFTRLEPAPETAKRVLQTIKRFYGENYLDNPRSEWNKVADEFGVTT